MIVKNESKIIERCIKSCLPVLDYISICDTGSTDNTVEIIEKFGKKYRITTAMKIIAGITKEAKYIVNNITKYKP